MCKICTNEYEGLEHLICSDCPLLTIIPNIEGLESILCLNCPLLTNIPNIKGLKKLYCYECPLLTNIPNIEGLQKLHCTSCPLLMYGPLMARNRHLNKPFEKCKYLTSKKMDALYNNIYKLWKSYKLNKYIKYLEREVYCNPRLPYMQYYIENKLYDENEDKLKIGYVNSKNQLIFYKF